MLSNFLLDFYQKSQSEFKKKAFSLLENQVKKKMNVEINDSFWDIFLSNDPKTTSFSYSTPLVRL